MSELVAGEMNQPGEVIVMAKALAEWSSPQYRWDDRHPNNRQMWLRLARIGYDAMCADRWPEEQKGKNR
jgi:hypothetical protein